MKNLTCRVWAKAVAFVLFFVMVALIGLCALSFVCTRQSDWAKRADAFDESWLAERAVRQEMNYLTDSLINGYYDSYKPRIDSAFSYRIVRGDVDSDEVVIDAVREGALPVVKDWSFYCASYASFDPEAAEGLIITESAAKTATQTPETAQTPEPTTTPTPEPTGEPEAAGESREVEPEVSPTPEPEEQLAGDYVIYDAERQLYSIEGYINLPVYSSSGFYAYARAWDAANSISELVIPLAIAAFVLAVLLFVFLMVSAGRRLEEGAVVIRLRGLDRLPFDVYTAVLALCIVFSLAVSVEWTYYSEIPLQAMGYGCAIMLSLFFLLAFFMTLAARLKTRGWYKNTLIYRLYRLLIRFFKWLFAALPMAWRAALGYIVFMVFNLLCVEGSDFSLLIAVIVDVAVFGALILYVTQLKKLRRGGEALASGDLSYTVDTSKMLWDFKRHGENLNSISLGVSRAVEERMKSERFKTELITNVSHDLKTPLTSIVSYVDLLKKQDISDDTAKEYIEVLDRQSAKLKKLTEDLVDASKASSGVIAVNKEKLDISELLTQCAGEYEERLASAGVSAVVTAPEGETIICADGRLLWRVLDNLLQNVTKYSLPGTRVYLGVEKKDWSVLVSIKNISRDPLNIPAEELMERFIRGDSSRSTEGSGLGLSIAKSLTELMGGELELKLDGDLFKVTLRFPAE